VLVEGGENVSNLLMVAAYVAHIDHAIALLDHGANVNKTVVHPDGRVLSPLTCTLCCGRHDLCRLFLTRGAIPTTNDVYSAFGKQDICINEKTWGFFINRKISSEGYRKTSSGKARRCCIIYLLNPITTLKPIIN
jgi:hypothetical protein